jgi:hypothetical protein
VAVGDRFHVRIDLARIQSNMLRDEGGKLSERQIRNWLISAGFTPDPDGPGWTADREALRQLDRSELLETKPIRRTPAGSPNVTETQRPAKRAAGLSQPGQDRGNGRASPDHIPGSKSSDRSPNNRKAASKRPEH